MCLKERQTYDYGYSLVSRRRGHTRKTHFSRNIWSARKARWRRWKIFGVDWEYVETKMKIIDIMRSKRHQMVSKTKCKINDAEKRPIRKFKLNKFKIHQQPGICVNPRLTKPNCEEKSLKISSKNLK